MKLSSPLDSSLAQWSVGMISNFLGIRHPPTSETSHMLPDFKCRFCGSKHISKNWDDKCMYCNKCDKHLPEYDDRTYGISNKQWMANTKEQNRLFEGKVTPLSDMNPDYRDKDSES